jgi:hypothetical protein
MLSDGMDILIHPWGKNRVQPLQDNALTITAIEPKSQIDQAIGDGRAACVCKGMPLPLDGGRRRGQVNWHQYQLSEKNEIHTM